MTDFHKEKITKSLEAIQENTNSERKWTNSFKKSKKTKQLKEIKKNCLKPENGNQIYTETQIEGILEMKNLEVQTGTSSTEYKRWRKDSQALEIQ